MKENKFLNSGVLQTLEKLKAKRDEFIVEFLKLEKLLKESKLSELVQKAFSLNDMHRKDEKISPQSLLPSSIKIFTSEEQLKQDYDRYKSAISSLENVISGFEDLLSDFNPKCNGPSTLQKMKELVNKHQAPLSELKPRNDFSRTYNQLAFLVGKSPRTTTMIYLENLISEMDKLIFANHGADIYTKSEKDWELLSIDEDWEKISTDESFKAH